MPTNENAQGYPIIRAIFPINEPAACMNGSRPFEEGLLQHLLQHQFEPFFIGIAQRQVLPVHQVYGFVLA